MHKLGIKKWKGHSWRNFISLWFYYSVREVRDNVCVSRNCWLILSNGVRKVWKESVKLKVIHCSGVSDERDEGQRCARRCGVKWILEIVVERQKGKVSIYENVEAHESDRATSGHREEEERSFVVQELAWHTEALIDRLERGKKI